MFLTPQGILGAIAFALIGIWLLNLVTKRSLDPGLAFYILMLAIVSMILSLALILCIFEDLARLV